MKKLHAFSPATFLPPPFSGRHQRAPHRLVRWTAVWLVPVILGVMWISEACAQSVEALQWQPGQYTSNLVQSTPHNDVRKLLRQAKYPQALLLVNQALTKNPRDPQMRFWQGFIYEQQGLTEQALSTYLGLTQEYPELAEPHNNLGVLYAAQGDYPKAKTSLEAALRANPVYAIAHENMGDLLINMARQSYERALVLNPKHTEPAQKIDRLKPVLNLTQNKP